MLTFRWNWQRCSFAARITEESKTNGQSQCSQRPEDHKPLRPQVEQIQALDPIQGLNSHNYPSSYSVRIGLLYGSLIGTVQTTYNISVPSAF
jgi:hypothetical protein